MKSARWMVNGCWVLVVATTLVAMTVGPTLDDYFHPLILRERGPLALYDFLGPDDIERHRYAGDLPWWTSPELSMRFFRPLSSLDLAVDHLFLDGGGLLSHLHGLVWYGVLLVLVYKLYCALFDPRIARFATPLYALAGWHAMPLAFVAARHTLMTAVFAMWSFYAVVQSHNSRRRCAWFAALVYLVALCAGESALLVVPLMFGYAVARGGVWSALMRLAPIVGLTLMHSAVYAAAGFGARGSSLYLAPFSRGFVRELPARWTSLAADAFGGLPMDLTLLGARPLQVVWGILALSLLGWVLRWQLRGDPARGKLLLGLVCGSLVSMIPASAAMPGGRALVVIGLSAGACFGTVLAELAREASNPRRWQQACSFIWVTVLGVGLHPAIRVIFAWDLRRLGDEVATLAHELGRRCHGRVILAPGALDMNIGFVNYFLELHGMPGPRGVHLLSMAPGRHTLTIFDAGEFELAVDGDFYASFWSRNHSDEPLRAPMEVKLRDVDVTLLATEPQTRLKVSVTTGAEVCWVTSGDGGLTVMTPVERTHSWTPRAPL